MNSINDGIRFINKSIDTFSDYIKENAVQLIIIGALIYYLKNSWKQQSQGYTLNQSRPAATNSNVTSKEDSCDSCDCQNNPPRSRDGHLMAVRERQQALANQRAQEAAQVRKEKEKKEKDRKNHVAKNKEKGGDRLGGDSGATCSYNPMQPWTGHSNGYRPARRSTRRGG